MKKLLFCTFITLSFGQSIDEIYKEASEFEKIGKYKEAMLLYKKAFNLKEKQRNLSKSLTENKTVSISNEKTEEKEKTYETLKKDFYKNHISKSEDKETNKNVEEILSSTFGLYPYKKNYLLLGTYDFEKQEDNRSQFETAFQISAKKPISYNIFGFNEVITLAYTQKSFWQTSRHSKPFRETNYLPEIYVEFPYTNSDYFKGYKVSLLHESNGRNKEFSRSWNRVYVEGSFQVSNLFVKPKVWYRIPDTKEDDNPDIHKYYGYGDLTLLYPYKNHTFDLVLRNNLEFNSSNKGSAEFNWTFPLPKFMSEAKAYGFLQYFTGFGNSLIDYNKETNKIGFGIAVSR